MSLRKPLGSRKGSSRLDTRAFRPDSSSCSSGSAALNWSCSRAPDRQYGWSVTLTGFWAMLGLCQTWHQQGEHACPWTSQPILHLVCDDHSGHA